MLPATSGCFETMNVAVGSLSIQTAEDSSEWAVVNWKNKLVKAVNTPLPSSLSSSSLVCATNFYIAKLKAACKTCSWHCKISNLHKDVFVNVVKEHLQSYSIEVIAVNELHSRSNSALSMHVVVPYDAKQTVMCNNFWPKGMRVSSRMLHRESRHQVHSQNS